MSDDGSKSKPKRRWRRIATGLITLSLLYFAASAWMNRGWLDPRFVGAWRVTSSKWQGEWIYVLREDGSAQWFERRWQGDPWWQRGPNGGPISWSVDREGFRLQELSPGAQMGGWLLSIGGLLNRGQFTRPLIVEKRSSKIESIGENQIRLSDTQPGIIIPTILTMDRLDPEVAPKAQP
jgi:hypothetical protein